MAVILVASGLFTWYVAAFGSYDATYGSLGAVFGFMTWLWITAIIVIVGAELNGEIERQTAGRRMAAGRSASSGGLEPQAPAAVFEVTPIQFQMRG